MQTENQCFENLDFGNFDVPDIDIEAFEFMPDEVANEDNRYVKPRLVPMKTDRVIFEHAKSLATEIDIANNPRYDCLVSGNFIFGDFIEAFLVHNNCKAKKMLISTLSLSQENIDSLVTLVQKGYIDELNMIVSDYFYSHERHNLIPYIYEQLDKDNVFQLAVAFVHTKICQFETLGGKKIVMHGSANLRSSGNVEQFCIEQNHELYDFYDEHLMRIVDDFKTIHKSRTKREYWRLLSNIK